MANSLNLDQNRWYYVHNAGNNDQNLLGTYLIYNNNTIGGVFIQNVNEASPEQIWQFFPSKDSYLLRTLAAGPNAYLSTYFNTNETRIGSTSVHMANITQFSAEEVASGNSSIFWKLGFFQNGDIYFYNQLNGSDWRILIKVGGFPVMDRNQDGPAGQRWNLTVARPINDRRYSSAVLPTAAAQETGTATAPPSSSATNSQDDGGLSTGAQAGIGVVVGLVGLALILMGIWFFLKRRKRIHSTPIPQADYYEPTDTKYAHEAQSSAFAELGGQPNGPAEITGTGIHKVNSIPAELPSENHR